MASLGMKRKRSRVESCFVDRLSVLPDDLIRRIFSSLDFLDVVRTSVLSTRWRYVWASSPFLNFNMDRFMEHLGNSSTSLELRYKFWNFVKRALLLRDSSSQIRRISLSSSDTIIDQLNGLLRDAARLKVQELSFHDGDSATKELEFPRVVCETLTSLTVEFRDIISVRATTVFKNLTSLCLKGVIMSNDALRKLFSSECVKLEDVHLEDCQFRDLELVTIGADNLRNLTILNASSCANVWILSSFDFKLNISAPNLVSFCYVGPMFRDFSLLNTVSLRHASFRILRVPNNYEAEWGREVNSPSVSRFNGLQYAESLTLSSVVVKYFSPAHSGHMEVPHILDNLKCLKVELRYNVDCIEGLIELLKLSPNLEALVIRFKEDQHMSWSMRSMRMRRRAICAWKSRIEDVACLSYHVKSIKFVNFDGSDPAIKLVKFLLQNGKVLEQMKILQIVGEEMVKNRMKLEVLPKASSRAVISFIQSPKTEFPWFDKGDSDRED